MLNRVDYSGVLKYKSDILLEVDSLQHLRESVENMMGEVSDTEWELASIDRASNMIMSECRKKDEIIVLDLVDSIEYLRRIEGGLAC